MEITKRVIFIGDSLGIILDKIICNGKIEQGDELVFDIKKIIKKNK
jgi:hypothetical protein